MGSSQQDKQGSWRIPDSLHAGPLYPPFSRMTGPAASRQVSLRDALPHWLGSFFESEVKHRCGVVAGQCKFGC